jgi:hypothetical protein
MSRLDGVSAHRGGALAPVRGSMRKSLISKMDLRKALRKSLISKIISGSCDDRRKSLIFWIFLDISDDVLRMRGPWSARDKLGSCRAGFQLRCLPRLPAQPLRAVQPEELITAGRGHGDGNDAAIGREGGWRGRPSACLQVRALLQHEAGGRRIPRNRGLGARALDGQDWGAGCLHRGDNAPKAAREGIRAAAHGGGGRLADGAAQGVSVRAGGAGAGAAAAADGVPIDAVLSLKRARRKERRAYNCDGQ